jgi:hypothetical protein
MAFQSSKASFFALQPQLLALSRRSLSNGPLRTEGWHACRHANLSGGLLRGRTLTVLTAFLSNPAEGLTGYSRLASLPRQVRKRYDPNQALGPVEDRQTTHLLFRHLLGDRAQILVLKHIPDFGRHDLAHLGACWITAVSRQAQSHVAIGYDANQPITLAHRQHPRVVFTHQLRNTLDGVVWVGKSCIRLHHVANATTPPILPLTFGAAGATMLELLLHRAQRSVSQAPN